MSRDRLSRRGLILAPVGLAACGFRPAFSPDSSGLRLRGRVAVEAPDTADGFRLRARLEDRLGTGRAGAARLAVEPEVVVSEAAVTPEGAITRYHLRGRASWRLVSPAGAVLARGEATGFSGYSATGTTVAARAAEEDARARLMGQLADDILDRLLLLPPEALS